MRRFVVLFFFMAALICSAGVTAQEKGAPSIVMEEKSWDFGNIDAAKGPVTHVFMFTNEGDAPLVILDARASCGCTKPKFTARPIDPGKNGEVSVTYNPAGNAGEFNKTVTVKTNDPKSKKITLKISGVVIPQ